MVRNNGAKIHISNDDSSNEKNDDSNTVYDDDSDSNSNSLYDLGDNSDTDDECTAGCTAGFEKARSSFYRHFTIYIIPNPDPEKPNTIFTKITLIHIIGENNNPRL